MTEKLIALLSYRVDGRPYYEVINEWRMKAGAEFSEAYEDIKFTRFGILTGGAE